MTCMDCHVPYHKHGLDITLPDAQWRLIHVSSGGLLCGRCLAKRAALLPGAIAIRAVIVFAPRHVPPLATVYGRVPPLAIVDGRKACPDCGQPSDLIAATADAEAPVDVWECPVCHHQFGP